jgi:hypothetical protein
MHQGGERHTFGFRQLWEVRNHGHKNLRTLVATARPPIIASLALS